ncbi:synaptophysin-like isoform X1 [Simochromis diagramma]|uniref:synaptophysin-like isoform X1 n=1 Tax=Simochromis diagramma TaxID=43689 RepID=UPI001A7EB930|nr:synaptophysin-like isoform X1 [Simochromis diagramma]XP_039878594.1 synaptophysin-like isoform X1 [Simochromis diagramma]XP_039878595.1 synaptophysin-like isoform X1 [Simochromis diagramma]XP_039878596.1 synaptophysin-like isoform X1 [Simochromis diagramma]
MVAPKTNTQGVAPKPNQWKTPLPDTRDLEKAVNTLVTRGRFGVLKVPLGFIKVLQWFFAIFAFSTCGSYSGMFKIAVECKSWVQSDLSIEVEFEYPFRLHQEYFDAPTCKSEYKERVFLTGDYSSSAEFFVTIGVFAFLYSTAALTIYVFFFEKYKENNKGPLIDLGVTGVFAFMWLVSSAAWAKGLSNVKTATNPDEVITMINACEDDENRCREVHDPVMSGLNTSVAFGFINLVLWAGNLWFIYRETGIIADSVLAPPPQEKPAAPDAHVKQGANEQETYTNKQAGHSPDCSQEGYPQVRRQCSGNKMLQQDVQYSQGSNQQGAPTSFSNHM